MATRFGSNCAKSARTTLEMWQPSTEWGWNLDQVLRREIDDQERRTIGEMAGQTPAVQCQILERKPHQQQVGGPQNGHRFGSITR